jgi:hypothetical protein
VELLEESRITARGLLPPLIDDKDGEPAITPRLQEMIDEIMELHNIGLKATHCAEGFARGVGKH